MARTHLTAKQLRAPYNQKNNTAILAKLTDFDHSLDSLELAGSALLVQDAITADASGRQVFQAGLFDASTVAAKFAAGAFAANSTIRALFAAGLIDSATATSIIAANAIDESKLARRVAAQALSGAGAINLTATTTLFTSTGSGQALTLADGSFAGQRKRIIHVADGGSGVITQTTGAKLTVGITTITFTAAWDWVELEWSGTLWNPVGISSATLIA